MKIKNKIIFIFILIFLNNCVQSSAMIGPTITLVSTGNVYQAGVGYGANKAVEKETGMPTQKYIIKKIDNSHDKQLKKKRDDMFKSLSILLELNIEKTKKKLN